MFLYNRNIPLAFGNACAEEILEMKKDTIFSLTKEIQEDLGIQFLNSLQDQPLNFKDTTLDQLSYLYREQIDKAIVGNSNAGFFEQNLAKAREIASKELKNTFEAYKLDYKLKKHSNYLSMLVNFNIEEYCDDEIIRCFWWIKLLGNIFLKAMQHLIYLKHPYQKTIYDIDKLKFDSCNQTKLVEEIQTKSGIYLLLKPEIRKFICTLSNIINQITSCYVQFFEYDYQLNKEEQLVLSNELKKALGEDFYKKYPKTNFGFNGNTIKLAHPTITKGSKEKDGFQKTLAWFRDKLSKVFSFEDILLVTAPNEKQPAYNLTIINAKAGYDKLMTNAELPAKIPAPKF